MCLSCMLHTQPNRRKHNADNISPFSNVILTKLGSFLGSKDAPSVTVTFVQTWKSGKHANNACRQFLRKLWTIFVKQQFSCNFHPSMPTSLHYYPQLMHFCLKISDLIEKNAILGTFICLGSI